MGGHNTLASRSLPVPVELSNFQGYTKPETHKHKRKAEKTFEQDFVSEHSLVLLLLTEKSYMKSLRWKSMRVIVLKLAVNLRGYASYLESRNEAFKKNSQQIKTFPFSDTGLFDIIPAKVTLNGKLKSRSGRLSEAVLTSEMYKVFYINEFSTTDRRKRFEFMKELILPCRFVKYCHTSAEVNMYFLWRIPVDAPEDEILNKSTEIRENLLKIIPKYHTRQMRAEFINSFGRATGCKSAILREAYRRLTGDGSSSRTVDEEAVDKRVNEFLSLEDPELIYDLRVNNKGQPGKYEKFLEVCQTYINSTVDTATDDRRHDSTSTL